MAEYTPDTDEIRAVWAAWSEYGGLTSRADDATDTERYAEFDRWLAAHDARVKRDAAREALDGLAENMRRISVGADEPLLRIQAAFAADIAAEYKATAYPETEDQT